jgi:hypothetical protein
LQNLTDTTLPDPIPLQIQFPIGNENDDWTDPAIAAAAARSGTFALTAGSRDAALLVTLPPGTYTAQVSGVGGSTGVALIEVYEVP